MKDSWLILIIALVIILICREITCWYFKINKRVDLLEEILAELRAKKI
jgi:hypothetical protein